MAKEEKVAYLSTGVECKDALREEPALCMRDTSCSSCMQREASENKYSSRMHFTNYALMRGIPDLYLTQERLEKIRENICTASPGSLTVLVWEDISKLTDAELMHHSEMKMKAYTGRDVSEWVRHAQDSFNTILVLAFAGAILSDFIYLEAARKMLIAWATADPLPATQLSDLQKSGLCISRFLDRIVESYRILALSMTSDMQDKVIHWIHCLGHAVKASHLYWLEHLQAEGANNRLSWHVFGMTVAGSYVFNHQDACILLS
jgi:hypothetical protein